MSEIKTIKRQPGPKAFEKEVENDINGYTTINSGGMIGWTADVYNRALHVECKFTSKPYIDFKADWLEKNYDEAVREQRVPVVAVRITNEYGGYFAFVPNLEDRMTVGMNKTIRLRNGDLERLRILGQSIRSPGMPVSYVVISGAELCEFAYECAKRMGIDL